MSNGPLAAYLAELQRYPLLTREEEVDLARRFRDQGDDRAGHTLVTSNLRFVVKVAFEYRSYGLRMADLVQEGNMGLMRAVQKFDPTKGVRLISYAVWWIRAYIQNYILANWSLVKLGTTQAQRKLFFSLAKAKRRIEAMNGEQGAEAKEIAKRLRVKPSEVREMSLRIDGRDLSLDAQMTDESGTSHVEMLACNRDRQDQLLETAQEEDLLRRCLAEALEGLDERERLIIQKRLLSEKPPTLREIGADLGFSRERARQLEMRAKQRIRAHLAARLTELGQGDVLPDDVEAH